MFDSSAQWDAFCLEILMKMNSLKIRSFVFILFVLKIAVDWRSWFTMLTYGLLSTNFSCLVTESLGVCVLHWWSYASHTMRHMHCRCSLNFLNDLHQLKVYLTLVYTKINCFSLEPLYRPSLLRCSRVYSFFRTFFLVHLSSKLEFAFFLFSFLQSKFAYWFPMRSSFPLHRRFHSTCSY